MTRHLLMKHQMSGAKDALIDFEIDTEEKIVEISMRTNGGKPFLSSAHLEGLIFWTLPQLHDCIAFNDDHVDSWTAKCTDWKIFATVGDIRFRVLAWNQLPSGGVPQRTIELFLEPL